ncbi:MAG TPA: RelA/SpoT domain-containing protein [Polyangiaceae bacterium]|nr:RelA/SpoT domain-containing protein [Polyangiaceae bacterium]
MDARQGQQIIMDLVEDFIGRYRREYDFYDQAARLAAQQLELRLQTAGVRAMVTFRAKSAARLEPKVRARARRKNYTKIESIYDDIPDLAGVRVALYFPAEREQVDLIIDELFALAQTKAFPDGSAAAYPKIFSGYKATHYRGSLRETTLPDAQKRYAEARIEIQVGSVLMHAWAEVEHDLVYKPFQGALSEDEYAILDELNGMILAGEIALERLQRAGNVRVAAAGRKFENHYELAAHLLNKLHALADPSTLKTGLGRVDLLYDLLAAISQATPEGVARYLPGLHSDLEKRPIAEQIVDLVLSENATERYRIYEELRATRPNPDLLRVAPESSDTDVHSAMGLFLREWIEFEQAVRLAANVAVSSIAQQVSFVQLIDSLQLDPQTRSMYHSLRRMRNELVHGHNIPDPERLREAAGELRAIRAKVSRP